MSSNYDTYKTYKRETKWLARLVLALACAMLFGAFYLTKSINGEVATYVAGIYIYLTILCLYALLFVSNIMQDDFVYYLDFTLDGKCHLDVEINNGPTNYYKFSLETIVAEKFDKKYLRVMDKERPNDSISIHIPYCKELENDINRAKQAYLKTYKKSDENT